MSDEDLAQPKNIGPVNLLTLRSRIVLHPCTWTAGIVWHVLRSARLCNLAIVPYTGSSCKASQSDIAESGALSL